MSQEHESARDQAANPGTTQDKSGPQQRRFPRFDYSIPVFVRVLVEEETFNPLRFPGQSLNIGRGGISIQIQSMTESDYRRLISRQRMVRVHCQMPEAHGEAVFYGKIVWYDYRSAVQGGPTCMIGIAFEPLHEKEEKALAELLRYLETASQSSSPVQKSE